MTTLYIENFVVKRVDALHTDEWEIESFPGEKIVARAWSRDHTCLNEYILENRYQHRKTSCFDEDGNLKKILYSKSVQLNTYNGTGTIKLSGGPVAKRYCTYDDPYFSKFKEEFGIINIKKIDKEECSPDYAFIIENTDSKKSVMIIPEETKVIGFFNENGSFSLKSISAPMKLEAKAGGNILAAVKSGDFFLFDEYLNKDTISRKRTLYLKGGINAIALRSDLQKLKDKNILEVS